MNLPKPDFMPGFMIAATRKSSGKTTISLGLARAFHNQGLKVATFKKGPDYIDPLWLKMAGHQKCYNLDFNTQSEPELLETFAYGCHNRDIVLLESNKGLFDGIDTLGSDSNAQMAKNLDLPVILVIDTQGITRGIAPLIQGYCNFDPDVRIAGLILNKTGGTRHEQKLRKAVETYCDIPIFGCVPRDQSLEIRERHLGLTTPGEKSEAEALVQKLAGVAEQYLDLNEIKAIGLERPAWNSGRSNPSGHHDNLTIAIARDEAFGFYYADDLELMERLGARLEFFSPLRDEMLPQADGLFIGGGFPETHMEALSANQSIRAQIRHAIKSRMPTYAECGGLMYLSQSITWHDQKAEMVGVIPGECRMHEKPQGRGYSRLEPTINHPWANLTGNDAFNSDTPALPAHEFHYASLDNLNSAENYAYQVKRGHGIDGKFDGYIGDNLLANFCHFRSTEQSPWVPAYLDWVAKNKKVTDIAATFIN